MKKLVPWKTRKAIHKSLRKIIKKHGPELAAAVAAGSLGKTVSEVLTGDGKKSRKLAVRPEKKGQARQQAGSADGADRDGRIKKPARVVAASVRDVLRGSKDATLGFAARTWLNSRLRGIGELSDLSIDTKRQRIHLRLRLSGEAEPTEVYVRKYTLKRKGERAMLTIVDATASRKWVAAILRKFVTGQTFPVPAQAATALKLLT